MDTVVERRDDSLLEDMFEDGDLGEPKNHVSIVYSLFFTIKWKTMTAPFQAPLEQGVEKE